MWIWLAYIIKLNGLYDILCAMTILDLINIPTLKNLHLSMFLVNCTESQVVRLLSYWIFTYGMIRLHSSESRVIYYSYYIEAAAIANEALVKKTMYVEKAWFVICSSILLGYMTEISK